MSDLVRRLIEREHSVEVSIRPGINVESFQNCLKRGYIHIRFIDTRGSTELGMKIDTARTNLTEADLTQQKGKVQMAGTLQLDFINVRCIAEIDISTFQGIGTLEECPPADHVAPGVERDQEVHDAGM
jgi:hypothetical protein